ncbi:Guanylate cyclase beta [Trichinella spiralis]|uniref:Guanylate cyclase beta n=1 Tax=Trichinella spiralis TaxID=6334 RepID=A0ABR3K9F6_TRISP
MYAQPKYANRRHGRKYSKLRKRQSFKKNYMEQPPGFEHPNMDVAKADLWLYTRKVPSHKNEAVALTVSK